MRNFILGFICSMLLIPTGVYAYVVQKGDTLNMIANGFNTTISDLVKLNNIKNKDLIYSGQVIETGNEIGATVVGVRQGGTGTSTVPSFGQLLMGDGNGGYFPTPTSSLGIVLVESDPIWTAASSSYLTTSSAASTYLTSSALTPYLTTTTASSTYLKIGNETDPIWTATSSNYLTVINAGNTYLKLTESATSSWNTAYSDRLKWDGGSTGLTAATGRTSLGLGTMALLANTGSSTITILGTIGTGVWQGTLVSSTYGGTNKNTSNWTGFPYITNGVWSTTTVVTAESDPVWLAASTSYAKISSINTFTATNTLATTTFTGFVGVNTTTPDAFFSVVGSGPTSSLFKSTTAGGMTALRIFAGGAVGFGTDSPGALVEFASSTGQADFITRGGGATPSLFRFISASGANYLQSATSSNSGSYADLVIGSMYNGTQWLTIKGANGNVGINTSTEDDMLSIVGKGTTNLFETYSSTGVSKFKIDSTGYATAYAVEAEKFVQKDSTFNEEFWRMTTTRTGNSDYAANQAASYGDFRELGVYSNTSANCNFSTPADTNGGVMRLATASTNTGCMTMLDEAANNPRLLTQASLLPTMEVKFLFNTTSSLNYAQVGLGTLTDGSTTDRQEFIGFTNQYNSNVWEGMTVTGGATTTVSCATLPIVTSTYFVGKFNVTATNHVDFYGDNDSSDGVNFVLCGSSTTNIPTGQLTIQVQNVALTGGTAATNLDLDYLRLWQY